VQNSPHTLAHRQAWTKHSTTPPGQFYCSAVPTPPPGRTLASSPLHHLTTPPDWWLALRQHSPPARCHDRYHAGGIPPPPPPTTCRNRDVLARHRADERDGGPVVCVLPIPIDPPMCGVGRCYSVMADWLPHIQFARRTVTRNGFRCCCRTPAVWSLPLFPANGNLPALVITGRLFYTPPPSPPPHQVWRRLTLFARQLNRRRCFVTGTLTVTDRDLVTRGTGGGTLFSERGRGAGRGDLPPPPTFPATGRYGITWQRNSHRS